MLKTVTFPALAALLQHALAQQFVMYTPNGDDTSVQRIDPILSPGTISQHVHQVFGSSALSPDMTYDSLQTSNCTTVADASDHGNAADHSVYWHPALYMEANNGSGYVRVPTNGHKLYYKDAGSSQDTKRSPFEFPHGFRMLAGNPFIRAAPSEVQRQNITQWICHNSPGYNQGTDGGFPTGVTDCTAYPGFNGAIHFPHCWNGADFDPANPTAHVVYPTGDIEEGECPADHPTRLPHIFIENQFDLHSVVDQVKPDTFVLAQGDNTGYGWHADFYNGWEDGAIPAILASCPPAEYGNEDVGNCSSFRATTIKASACLLPKTFDENVDYPGQYLPGCNPVIDTNPAPIMAVAPLGVSTNDCSAAQAPLESSATSSPASYTPPSSSATTSPTIPTAYSSPASSSTTSPSLPMTTLTTIATSAASPTTSGSSTTLATSATSTSISCPADNGNTYTASNGAAFQIECATDHAAGDMGMVQLPTGGLSACVEACASTSGCVDVSLSGVACYLKKSLDTQLVDAGINGAKLITAAAAAATTPPAAEYVTHGRHAFAHLARKAV